MQGVRRLDRHARFGMDRRPRRPAAAPELRSNAVARQDHQRGLVGRWFGVAGAASTSDLVDLGALARHHRVATVVADQHQQLNPGFPLRTSAAMIVGRSRHYDNDKRKGEVCANGQRLR